ncbi:hypothetical protein L596_025842 [Steinernema carpocapsae]|uniref:Uncharacterized protein n=1 Tax=Steinernema carpocapsae TaxID=34508 RepID=A0A4U5M8X8_STECR|nr:hypothetical protein L596_025842 [Steinernema carpocapsae]
MELQPELPVRLRLNGKDDYCWHKVKTTIQNATAAPEKRILRHEGVMILKSSNGVSARIEFKGQKNAISGTISGPTGQVKISGSWDKAIYNHQYEIQTRRGRPRMPLRSPVPALHPLANRYYGFSRFSMTLNELLPDDIPSLPLTDSRFRPDQRALENGEAQRASSIKQTIEQNQRNRSKQGHRQLWFSLQMDSFSETELWISQGKYWDAKEDQFKEASSGMVRIFTI